MKTPAYGPHFLNRRHFLKSLAAGCAATGTVATRAGENPLSATPKIGVKLPHRALGKTGVTVSALALGGVIGMQLPPSADHDPAAIAETALNLGVTY
ncbi:MAG TPA: twin-arginine translocation signal domain-containing protein, partial [Bacillota bacterium]|nr:twin-arginine translocation signal domain-containing protein [Bacillota bacterium]